jgi:hypothetical protein
MTIKTQGGKIITKDGKVSCECCDVECCLYPAQALADGEYSANDLPDAVTVDGTSFSRSGTSYGNTTNGVILEENVWAKYRNAARSTRACLIQGGVKDQFADTYIIDFPFFDFASQGNVVTRTSLGRWEGTATFFSETFPLILSACPSGQLDIIGWAVLVEYTDPGGYALADPHTYDPETNIYISRPNTPVGNYVLIDYDPSFGLVVVS